LVGSDTNPGAARGMKVKNSKQLFILPAILFLFSCMDSPSKPIADEHIRFFIPDGTGPFPTLIALPGCSGIAFRLAEAERSASELTEDDRAFRQHYIWMAERLHASGYAVLLIDVLSAEERVTACGDTVPSQVIADYIDAAIAHALDASFVDDQRISLIGWSMGGWGTLAWLARQDTRMNAVRSAAGVYPNCMDIEPLTTEIPVLMLLGGGDDITPPSVCRALVGDSEARELISLHEYPNARHGFDVVGLPPVLELADGISVGYQEQAANAAWGELVEFFQD
jgi:dienelactone hydrolase